MKCDGGEQQTMTQERSCFISPVISLLTFHLSLLLHRFIRFLGDPVQCLLQLLPLGLEHFVAGVRRDPNRFAPDEHPSSHRVRQQEAIPTLKVFFFEQLNVTGTTGSPVAFARWIVPI